MRPSTSLASGRYASGARGSWTEPTAGRRASAAPGLDVEPESTMFRTASHPRNQGERDLRFEGQRRVAAGEHEPKRVCGRARPLRLRSCAARARHGRPGARRGCRPRGSTGHVPTTYDDPHWHLGPSHFQHRGQYAGRSRIVRETCEGRPRGRPDAGEELPTGSNGYFADPGFSCLSALKRAFF